jgi:FkbM family methyltransferase
MIDVKEIKYFELSYYHFDNDLLIDVGGFEGNWTELCLKINPNYKIKIFEPNLQNYQIICEKFKSNKEIEVFNLGLSNSNSKLTYYNIINSQSTIRGISGFVFRPIYNNYNYSKIEIDVVKLDDVIKENIDFIKIDTEGFELNVIEGCEKLLTNKKIKFLQFEYGGTFKDKNISLNDIISFLKKYDYVVYNIDKNEKLIKIDYFKDDYNYDNFLATHINLIKNDF